MGSGLGLLIGLHVGSLFAFGYLISRAEDRIVNEIRRATRKENRGLRLGGEIWEKADPSDPDALG